MGFEMFAAAAAAPKGATAVVLSAATQRGDFENGVSECAWDYVSCGVDRAWHMLFVTDDARSETYNFSHAAF